MYDLKVPAKGVHKQVLCTCDYYRYITTREIGDYNPLPRHSSIYLFNAIMNRYGPRGALIALGIFLRFAAYAQVIPSPQQRPDLWVMHQDSTYSYLVQGSDTLAPDDYSPSYEYEMAYDSCHVMYTFTECKRNGHRLTLLHWQQNRIAHAAARILSFNSRSADFPLVAGDTISFFRDTRWSDLRRRQTTTNFQSLDSLDFAVELVRASDSARIALLDSMGYLPRFQPGPPVLHGTRPMMALGSYVVPTSIAGGDAFVRVLMYPRGSGAYHFMRRDGITIAMSEMLNHPGATAYINSFSNFFNKRSPADLAAVETAGSLKVDIAGDEARIIFRTAPNGERTAIVVYDATGAPVFSPYATTLADGEEQAVIYRFPSPGLYIVGLLHDWRLVGSRKIIITE